MAAGEILGFCVATGAECYSGNRRVRDGADRVHHHQRSLATLPRRWIVTHIDDACADGEHERVWRGNVPVCKQCGLSTQTLADYLGHEQFQKAAAVRY